MAPPALAAAPRRGRAARVQVRHRPRPHPARRAPVAAGGQGLGRLGVEFSACYTSPKVRARAPRSSPARRWASIPSRAARSPTFDREVAHELLLGPRRRRELAARRPRPRLLPVVHDLTGGGSTSRRAGSRRSDGSAAGSCWGCCARASWSRWPALGGAVAAPRGDRERDLGARAQRRARRRTRRGYGPSRREGRGRRRRAGMPAAAKCDASLAPPRWTPRTPARPSASVARREQRLGRRPRRPSRATCGRARR